MMKISAPVTSGSQGSNAKHCWHEKAPAIHAITTSMWLDERALLTCMAYVDLNPIRAAMAIDLTGSDFTSIKERIENQNTWLSGFIRLIPDPHPFGADVKILSRRIFGKGHNDLPFYLSSYIDLVDETGRCIRGDKRGYVSEKTTKTINKIGIDPNCWLEELKGFKSIGFYSYHP